ncbi:MAG: hypothetical protein ACFBQW_09190, partial [Sphingomonadaceae bacterium]
MAETPDDVEQALLDRALAGLEARGFIEYFGEYGDEIASFVPLVAWMRDEGRLEGRKVRTYRGMEPYYFFLDPDQLELKDDARRWHRNAERVWPSRHAAYARPRPWLRPPDYRAHYLPRARRFARPTLFVQNKFAVEWEGGPVNFLPLRPLAEVLRMARGRFQTVYSRPGIMGALEGYSRDHNIFCHYPDVALLKRFPEVLVLEQMAAREGRSYNELKLEILAGAHLFLSSQGGGSYILAAHGDSLLVILHLEGAEFPGAYREGLFTFLADPPPRLAVLRGWP